MRKLMVLTVFLWLGARAEPGLWWDARCSGRNELTFTLNSDVPATGVRIGAITDHGASGYFTACAVAPEFDAARSPGMSVPEFDALLASVGFPASGLAAGDWAWIDAVSSGQTTTTNILVLTYQCGEALDFCPLTISGLADPTGLLGLDARISLMTGLVPMPDIVVWGKPYCIPEPTTLALLGLGGILLRRGRDQYSR